MTPLSAFTGNAGSNPGLHATSQPAPRGWLHELQRRGEALAWAPASLEARHGSGCATAFIVDAGHAGERAAAMPVSRYPAQAPDATPVRLHAEHGATGLRVWLGVDIRSPGVTGHARAVLAGLFAGANAGTHRIASVVCNGTPIHPGDVPWPLRSGRPNLFQEQPWSSAH